MKPVFSIVIPTYNRANVIIRTLDSVLAQTYQDWECLIVDDFSSDNTKEVISKYCKKDKRFRYFVNEGMKGAQGARNTGITHSEGKFVSFLDSDDTWENEMLSYQLQAYQNDENVYCVYARIQTILPNGNKEPWNIYKNLNGYIYPEVLCQGYLTGTISLSAKKECFDRVGMFDANFPSSQDDDMCFRLAKYYKIGFIDQLLANAYVSVDNRISANLNRVATGWWMLWNKYESDVLEYCGKDVMAKHYKECLHNFVHANNSKMTWKAYKKCQQYGGCFSIKKRLGIVAYCLSCGKIQYVVRKIQSVI